MKKLELQPTNENLYNTFLEDAIGRDKNIVSFVNILNHLDGCYTIALDGKWGSGKTFFVKQVKMVINNQNDFIAKKPYIEDTNTGIETEIQKEKSAINKKVTNLTNNNIEAELPPVQYGVYYDAWKNDNDTDPILSLVYNIISSIDSIIELKEDIKFVDIALEIVKIFTGKDFSKTVDLIKGKDLLAEIRSQKKTQELVKEFFAQLPIERAERVVIFIDELDRCKPSYAIKVLERIKHYFNNDRLTFVFSVDIEQLQHTVKKFYGTEFDACAYLDRFFDLRLNLPSVDIKTFCKSIDFNTNDMSYIDIITTAVIKKYNFELRTITKYISLVKIATYKNAKNNRNGFKDGNGYNFGLLLIVPLMIGLKLKNIDAYHRFIKGEDSSPLLKLSRKLPDSFFDSFLYDPKTPNTLEKDTPSVSLEDNLNKIYDAIFNDTDDYAHIEIGECSFNHSTLNYINGTENLLSNMADFDI